MNRTQLPETLDPAVFTFWLPPAGRSLKVGPEQNCVPLPELPLPIAREALADVPEPGADAIGEGLYAYLRRFPDCPHNAAYAGLLREAFPHYLAEIGSQIVMLDAKEVDPPYVRRKIRYLKILLLLEPENPGLLQQLGMANYQVGLMFSELERCRYDLLRAMHFLQRGLKVMPEDCATHNYLGQIDYLLGDYPGAARHWQTIVEALEHGPARTAFVGRLARIERGDVPESPLIDDLEAIGHAAMAYADGRVEEAKLLLERLEREAVLPAEMPMPEFYHFLGLCRERTGDPGGAFEAFGKALQLDPDFALAREAQERTREREGR